MQWFLLPLLSLALFSVPQVFAGSFRAGAAAVDITPVEWPLHLRGSFRPNLATKAHDPLMSRALVLSDGSTTVAVVVVDSCMVGQDQLDRAKAVANKACGLPTERMLIASTHTHSAPFAGRSNTPAEAAYQTHLEAGIAKSIVDAVGDLRAAQLGYASAPLADEVNNRRWHLKPGTMPANPFGETTDQVKMNPNRAHIVRPAGPVDPSVGLLAVRSHRGQPLAALGNYALHYVGNTGGEVSADYFGEFARLMRNRMRVKEGGAFTAMLSNGASGDINNIQFRQRRRPREPFEQIRIVATKTADAAWDAAQEIDYEPQGEIGMRERQVTLDVRVPTEKELKRARGYLEQAKSDPASVPFLAKLYAERTIGMLELGETMDVKVQAVRVGELAICSLPFEVLVEIGLELKEKSPFENTMVIELANGGFGYLPPPHQHKLGGYETWLGTSRVRPDSSTRLVKELLEMLAELK